MRLAARASGNKENIRRAAHMKMLANSAQTIPLWVGQVHGNIRKVHLNLNLWSGWRGTSRAVRCGAGRPELCGQHGGHGGRSGQQPELP